MAEDSDLSTILLNDIETSIEVIHEHPQEKVWRKDLKDMPTFTIKEIELHHKNSGKYPGTSIIKTLDRGRRFKDERYISADSIFTAVTDTGFFGKGRCKASMKKEIRDVEICLDRMNGVVISAVCTCPAGNSCYCNHIMALLFELADYSLNGLIKVPEEISCTSESRQWGVPSENKCFKDPAMTSPIRSGGDKKGLTPSFMILESITASII